MQCYYSSLCLKDGIPNVLIRVQNEDLQLVLVLKFSTQLIAN